MTIKELTLKNRSYRRFDETYIIKLDTLNELIDNARMIASARNAQPLKYGLISDPQLCHQLTKMAGWAGYLTDWQGPEKGERPTAYIVVLGDESISTTFAIDAGIALQTILLDATERGLGGCMIATFKVQEVTHLLNIEKPLKPIYLVALGKPTEEVTIEKMKEGDFKYWRDENQVHHVPKRPIEEVLVFKKF